MPEQTYAEGSALHEWHTAVAALYHSRAGQATIAEIGVRRSREEAWC